MRIFVKDAGRQIWSACLPSFLFFCLIALLISCAGPESVIEYQSGQIIDGVPFFPQEEYQCGPASLAGVLGYLGMDITPDEISKDIFSKSAKGTLNIDMIIYPQKKGFVSEQYSGNMEDLREKIDSGYPLIVFVDYGFWVMQENHFMVVVGYNEYGIIANSGKDRHKFISTEDFIKTWERTKFWTLQIKKSKQ